MSRLPGWLLVGFLGVGCATDEVSREHQAGVGQVTICHLADETSVSVVVGDPAVATHLEHGDTYGACGTTASVTVDDEGGEVSTDAVRLEIPPGAINDPVTITVAESSEPAPPELEAVTPVFEFGPEGLQFSKPVAVTLPAPPSSDRLTVYWTTADGAGWEPVGGTVDGDTITAYVTHFSKGVVGKSPGTRTVTGVSFDHWYYDAKPHGYGQAIDLSALAVAALVDDGMGGTVEIPGKGYPNGTFSITGVPEGTYTLRVDDELIRFEGGPGGGTPSTVNLGHVMLGRPDQAPAECVTPDCRTPLHLDVSGMQPWKEGDSLELYSTNANAWYFSMEASADPPLAADTTHPAFQVDTFTALGHPTNLLQGSAGDGAVLVHMTTRESTTGYEYQGSSHVATWSPVPFDQVSGADATLAGAFAPVTDVGTVRLDWRQTEYACPAVLQPVHPDGFTVPHLSNVGGLVQLPFSGDHGHYSSSLDLLLLRAQEAILTEEPGCDGPIDLDTGSMDFPVFAGPFASSRPVALAIGTLVVEYSLGPGYSAYLGGGVRSEIELPCDDGDADGQCDYAGDLVVLAPTVSPPLDLRIDGADAQAEQEDVGTTPTLSWAAGTRTVPGVLYVVTVHRLDYDGHGTSWQVVGSFQTNKTSVAVPAGVLHPGRTYVASITAWDLPGYDPMNPLVRSFPNTSATSLTSMLSPTTRAGVRSCDPLEPSACDSGEKCALATHDLYDDPGVTICAPAGLTEAGGSCSFSPAPDLFDNCIADHSCQSGGCAAICAGDSDCTSGTCHAVHDGLIAVCAVSCDPIAQDCPAPQACYFDQSVGDHICAPSQGGGAGAPCALHGECARGLACERDGSGQRICTEQCELGGTSCGGGAYCQSRGSWLVGVCEPLACDPVAETGCDSGEKCAVQTSDFRYDPGMLACVPEGTQPEGASCTAATGGPDFDDCASGSHCHEGRCAPTCWTAGDCALDEVCGAPHGGALRFCYRSCLAFLDDPGQCPAGEGCYHDDSLGDGACLPAGGGGPGAACTVHTDCSAGTGCHDDTGGRMCMSYFEP